MSDTGKQWPRVVSAADLGTNTVKISHAMVHVGGEIVTLRDEASTIRLGMGIEETGAIEPSRIDQCLEILKAEEREGILLGSDTFIGVATEALRVASNGDELLARIRQETRWDIKVISGQDEAHLTFLGLQDHVPARESALIVDIGGGSTEIISIDNDVVHESLSLPLGSGRLADQFFKSDPPGIQSIMEAAAAATGKLESAASLRDEVDIILLAGGNGMFLHALLEKRFDGVPLSSASIENLLVYLADAPSQDTAEILGIARERARVLPAGGAIALAVLLRVNAARVNAVPSGIRTGLIRNYMDGASR